MNFKCSKWLKYPIPITLTFIILIDIVFKQYSTLPYFVLLNLWLINMWFTHYCIEGDRLIIRTFKQVKEVDLSEVIHMRRFYGMVEKDVKDRSAIYMIHDQKKYFKLYKIQKNDKGQSIVDYLIDDYHIELSNEYASFIIDTKIKWLFYGRERQCLL